MVAKTDPDFDAYERDMAEFFAAGKKEGQSSNQREVQSNKRRSLELREEQQAAQRRREAQRDANRVAASQAQPRAATTRKPAPISAPNLGASSSQTSSITGVGLTRQQTSKLILLIVGLGLIGTFAHNALGGAPSKTQKTLTTNDPQTGKPQTVNIPTSLSSVGGILIMGVVALIVNEIDPGIGLILGLGIAFDVINSDFLGNNGLFSRLQQNLFTGPSVTTPSGAAVPTGKNAKGQPVYGSFTHPSASI